MTGTDVQDWQQFLTNRSLYTDPIDGIFGPDTAQATRDYQTSAGLGVDGTVGPKTFAQAIRDGFQSSTRALAVGMDASVDCTDFAQCIVSTGMKFVVRYYSQFANKLLTVDEAQALSDAGLQLVVVYQDKQNALRFFDADQGTASAARALTIAQGIGQPAGSAIYFAVDFDPATDDVRGPVSSYFQAVNLAFQAAPVSYKIGVYGSGLTCRLIRDASLAQYAWLSQSTGFREYVAFRPRATMIQIAPDRWICDGQLNIDDDIAQVQDYGAFRLPAIS
jgi:peptidoglycan hydrolase-like protein with peptidoglycan-binding domain